MKEEQSRSSPELSETDDRELPVDSGTLDAALGATAAGILVVDSGTVSFANDAVERYLDTDPDEVTGKPAGHVFPDSVAAAVETVSETGDERTAEWTVESTVPEGDRAVTATLVPEAERGRVVLTLGFGAAASQPSPSQESADAHSDGTQSQSSGTQSQSGSTQSDGTLSPDSPVTDDGVALLTLDTAGEITGVNERGEALTGWTATEVVGRHVSVLYPTDAADDAPDRALERARDRGQIEDEGWRQRSDGSKFWAATTVTPRRRSDGGIDGFRLILRDRTDRKRVEDERALLAAVNHAVADADTFGDGVETALEAICSHTEWAYGEAWVPADDGDYLQHLVAHTEDEGLEPFLLASRDVTFPFEEGLPGRVWVSGSAEWIPDASAESEDVFYRRAAAEGVGLQAALGVPIVTEDRVVAVLTFFLRERRADDEELVDAVTDVAADLGVLMARRRAEDRLERERSLLSRIFETSPIGLLVTDAGERVVRANAQASDIFGRPSDALVGTAFGRLADSFGDVNGDPVPVDELPVASALANERVVTDVELELDAEGDHAEWISVSAAPFGSADGPVERVVVVVEDVTERRAREQSLRTFREAVEQAGHSVYVTDTDGIIEYVNPTFERVTGYSADRAIGADPSILNSGEHDDAFFEDLWETIYAGDIWTGEVVNRRKSGETYVVNQTIAPIVDESGAIERFVAINDEITEQKRRERELRRQRNSLERIKQIIESLRPINRALSRADTREAIDRRLCEQLAGSEAYLFAWIGDYNSAVGAISPRERAGVEDEFLAEIDLSLSADGDADDLFLKAVADGTVQVRREIPTSLASDERQNRALAYGFQSQAAIPVVYGDTVLGVLGVYSARPDAFDEYEQGLLRELGERVGHAINAAENRQLLHTDTVVELEFEVGEPDSAVVGVADERGCRLSLNSVTAASDDAYACYLEVDGAAPAAVAEAFDSRSSVNRARVVNAHGQTGIVELTGRLDPIATLVEYGATVRAFETAGDTATLRCEIAPRSDVEALITDVEDAGVGTVFVAKRTRDRDMRTLELTKTAVEERLTDRQREALALAFHAGYFASPRHSTGEELADVLGIASPTFYQHVREGTRKILELVVGDDEPDSATPTRSREDS
ncbi:PAS domain S-box protein [Halosimplex sp. TS25]|uniref:PAS domain S-box protein n=1 Tax=Halosimplex rarum TaxID=3396619 RepID=UPI0039EC4B79